MTILDKIHKARELVAAMDQHYRDNPIKGLRDSRESTAEGRDAAVACIALLRDPELLALADEVAFLRVTLGAENDRLQRAEAAESRLADQETITDFYADATSIWSQRAEAAEAKLAAAEGDARRYRWLRLCVTASDIRQYEEYDDVINTFPKDTDNAIDAAIGAAK